MGDSVSPAAPEALVPFVAEAADLGPLFNPWGHSDAVLLAFFDQDEPLPPAVVPLDGSALFLATALVALVALRLWRVGA